jgi:TrmH family RNA methyltransferase
MNKFSLIRKLLKDAKYRCQEQLFVVEGLYLVESVLRSCEALENNRINFVVYCKPFPLVDQLKARGTECLKVTSKQFSEISQVETPQGILAVVKIKQNKLENLFCQNNPLIVYCLEVQDPGNLGTIIRSADAAGAAGVILSKGTVDLYNPKVVRSTMGSIFHLPIVQVEDNKATILLLKSKKIKIIGTSLNAPKPYFNEDYNLPAAVLVGNEGAGISEEILSLCDKTVKIPMLGKAESLNAAVSAAIIMYEAVRQRMKLSC